MTDEDKLEALMGAYDWQEAMKYSKFRFDQIDRVVLAIEGDHDGPDWLLLVELKGGGFGSLRAGCDYTGWDCQAGGDSGIFERLEQAYEWLYHPKRWPNDNTVEERMPPLKDILNIIP